ncbi:MAG: hypothetical protein ABIS06_22160, partial [Vicinamibacterales bacterium]
NAELTAMRSTMAAVASDDHPQPSPLFWDHLAQQVNHRIDAPRSGWSAWIRGPRLAGALVAAALMIIVASGARTLYPPFTAPPAADLTSMDTSSGATAEPADDVETDAAWAVVRTAAQDFVYEDAERAGIAPQPGAAERAVTEMSNEERAELARLLDSEMRRTGA